MELCEHLPSSQLDVMTSPNTWCVPSEKFRKATLVRCHLAANSRRLDNSLFWLNPIVDNIIKFEKLVTFLPFITLSPYEALNSRISFSVIKNLCFGTLPFFYIAMAMTNMFAIGQWKSRVEFRQRCSKRVQTLNF